MTQISHLSDHLRATRNRMADNRHGGIVMQGEPLEAFIRRFDAFVEMARAIEAALEQLQTEIAFHRACNDLVKRKAARILGIDWGVDAGSAAATDAHVGGLRGAADALRHPNVIRFPLGRTVRRPGDGDIA